MEQIEGLLCGVLCFHSVLFSWKLHLLIYFVLFLTTVWMCYRTIKGTLGSCESLRFLPEKLSFWYCFYWAAYFVVGSLWVVLGSLWDRCGIVVGSLWDRCGIVVGSLWDRCGSLWIVVGSLWVVVDRCGSLWVVPGFSNYVGNSRLRQHA